MDLLASFLDMGGYGHFVWPAFALTLLAMGGVLVESTTTLRARQRTFAALQGRRRPSRVGSDTLAEDRRERL